MLYTRKGDDGTTEAFICKATSALGRRISKSSLVAEALGALDETNSFLGLARARTKEKFFEIKGHAEGRASEKIKFSDLILEVQQNLFIIQAEVAGATLSMDTEKVNRVEKIVDEIEKNLPPIKSFFVSGATKDGAVLDISRTLARRAERRVIAVQEEGKTKVGPETLAYLNRLSSLLYALARMVNHLDGSEEIKPDYK